MTDSMVQILYLQDRARLSVRIEGREDIDARVYVGIHYRNSDVTAGAQGRRVANWVFTHILRPVKEPGDDRED